ncbi:uncharacterized protein UV8b_02251 [Ustilaginoidea virens]|uniref:Uncharacterized protein n=1 Tax=Ustilaginoidea virens TaxID=1159556 RepID=A0A8E5HM44_USTVR|nr:uncharacterized protein UV8b_02251 [Ustilaginoidea virens]QUC18010.1 hypothetical protein UV8b_02251 [Ustilaginoidea virens]
MAKSATQHQQHQQHREPIKKLAPIPQGCKIQKRPLMRPQLSASSKSPTIYVSSHTPFVSAVKRVRKLLAKSLRTAGPAPKNASLQSRVESLKQNTASASDRPPALVVTVAGTGKAIEKTLSLASWFEQEGDCNVCLRTRTVGAVDDIVPREAGEGEGEADESRVRKVSCLEVLVSLK